MTDTRAGPQPWPHLLQPTETTEENPHPQPCTGDRGKVLQGVLCEVQGVLIGEILGVLIEVLMVLGILIEDILGVQIEEILEVLIGEFLEVLIGEILEVLIGEIPGVLIGEIPGVLIEEILGALIGVQEIMRDCHLCLQTEGGLTDTVRDSLKDSLRGGQRGSLIEGQTASGVAPLPLYPGTAMAEETASNHDNTRNSFKYS